MAGKGYNGYLFMERAVDFITTHNPNNGSLFLYMAPADAHTPLQAPQEFLDLYPEDWYLDRRQYVQLDCCISHRTVNVFKVASGLAFK